MTEGPTERTEEEEAAARPATGSRAVVSNVRRRGRLVGRAIGVVRPVLIDRVERDHHQTDAAFRRRRIVVALTILVGATLLGLSFSTEQGDPRFYALTLGLAATWVIGSVASGPLHLGHIMLRGNRRRPIITPIIVGLVLAAIFIAGSLIIRLIPPLAGYAEDVLGYARAGNLAVVAVITLVNGIAEEMFFRGALFAAIGVKHPVLISTVLYALATVAGGNPVLVLAAAILGAVVGLQRRAGGGILAPILTHITWSMSMLFLLPPIFAGVL
ncbi:MAG: type II CAAX endopeptidase family protein [Propionibacteriaceae bacterium]